MFFPKPTTQELEKRPQAIVLLKDGQPVSCIARGLGVRRTIVFRWRAEIEIPDACESPRKGFCPRCRCTVYLPCMTCEIKAAITEWCSGLPELDDDDDAAEESIALNFRTQKTAQRQAAIFHRPQPSDVRKISSVAIRPHPSDPNAADTSDEKARLIRQQEEHRKTASR